MSLYLLVWGLMMVVKAVCPGDYDASKGGVAQESN